MRKEDSKVERLQIKKKNVKGNSFFNIKRKPTWELC
jgi:hypothetical protein